MLTKEKDLDLPKIVKNISQRAPALRGTYDSNFILIRSVVQEKLQYKLMKQHVLFVRITNWTGNDILLIQNTVSYWDLTSGVVTISITFYITQCTLQISVARRRKTNQTYCNTSQLKPLIFIKFMAYNPLTGWCCLLPFTRFKSPISSQFINSQFFFFYFLVNNKIFYNSKEIL